MATMETKKNKNGINIKVRFYINKDRHTLSLGSKYTVKQAEEIKSHVERIAQAIETGRDFSELPRATRGFLTTLADNLKQRFIACGLLEETKTDTLGSLWDMLDEHAEKMGFKEHTTNNYETARKWFFKYFSEEQQTDTVTEKDAEEFRAWLERQNNKYGKRLASTSVAGIVKVTKTVFNLARRARLIDRSPFEFIKRGSFVNKTRQFEVSTDIVSDVLDACPSQGWRVLFVLWRFAAMRKMEPLLLKWEDILWNQGKIRVHSPKTERHEGHEERFCPLFPEIRRELEDMFELAEPGAVYVFPDEIRERSENAIYNATKRIIRRAGHPAWQKVVVNMRATRVSELKRAGFSSDQRTAFIGHSEDISEKHYQIPSMLVGKEDYDRACSFQTLQTEQANPSQTEVLGTNLGIPTR